MEFETLKIHRLDNGRATITLSRPELMNRVDDESREELIAALIEVGQGPRDPLRGPGGGGQGLLRGRGFRHDAPQERRSRGGQPGD